MKKMRLLLFLRNWVCLLMFAIQGFIQYVIEHKALPFPVSEEALKAIQAKPTTKAKKGDIFEYVRTKSPLQQRCFSTAQADEFISQLRDNWEKQ